MDQTSGSASPFVRALVVSVQEFADAAAKIAACSADDPRLFELTRQYVDATDRLGRDFVSLTDHSASLVLERAAASMATPAVRIRRKRTAFTQ